MQLRNGKVIETPSIKSKSGKNGKSSKSSKSKSTKARKKAAPKRKAVAKKSR